MNRMGCPCGILFCFSFPPMNCFSSIRLVKKSRSKTFIYKYWPTISDLKECNDLMLNITCSGGVVP